MTEAMYSGALPAFVRVCECWPRDGIQSWPQPIPTDQKISVIDGVLAAGVQELDATSFVPIKVVPQFFDNLTILEHLSAREVYVRVLAPNLRGFQLAVAAHQSTGAINAIGFPISASEAHNLANVRRTHEQHLSEIKDMVQTGLDAGVQVMAAVATAFGCPIIGDVDEELVFGIAGTLVDYGVSRLMLSDTTGLADPVRVQRFIRRARREFPEVDLIAHFHDTRGTGLLNTWAALQGGVTTVDSSLGGLGGEPPAVDQNHSGETGNVATEDLVVALERAGVSTGIDVEALLRAGRVQEQVTGVTSRAQVLRTGTGLPAGQ
ncbi:hydroxymethylglutaryl-CoA lyase [Acidothermaceae bacterium B102]|nr:hydroxymethylglutaryl-CoA lyase [Acidothermaceae bacterium B102]